MDTVAYEQAVKARKDFEAVKARALEDLQRQKADIEAKIRDLSGKTPAPEGKKRGRPRKEDKLALQNPVRVV